ncbi:MAG TPA: anhydro-N-acetylmuramic acid kinase [Natronosporangium sp.]
MTRVLGLISGTSVDGVDAAAAAIELVDGVLRIERLGELTMPWPAQLRDRVLAARSGAPVGAGELCRLHHDLGTALGELAVRAIEQLGPVDLVASHGQTVQHLVEAGTVRGTLQLGQPAQLAERTGLPVVADFRARDVAAGGQGAPLVSLLDRLLLAGRGPVAALNLGGIANLTVLRPRQPPLAFDTGPGNTLLDLAATRAGERYDAGGERTARGAVVPTLLEALLADPYLAQPPPKTTGQERYHAGFLDAALAAVPPVGLDDLLATLAEFTAAAVADAAARFGVRLVFASGGGVHNAGLMAALRRRLAAAGAGLETTDALGLPVDAKEAYAFAVLGWLTWHGLPGTIASCTGAAAPRILGTITPGAGPLRLPAPLPALPDRAVMRLGPGIGGVRE